MPPDGRGLESAHLVQVYGIEGPKDPAWGRAELARSRQAVELAAEHVPSDAGAAAKQRAPGRVGEQRLHVKFPALGTRDVGFQTFFSLLAPSD